MNLQGFQSNIAADINRLTSGVTLTDVNYIGVVCRELYLDDVRFSNSLTTQTEMVGPGSIGHILRDRTFDSTRPWMETGTWFHYDQVGSVMCSTDNAGALVSQVQQDTFGNTKSGWATGQWGGTKAGWHHNSKEYDGDVDLVLMGMRWYLPETGTFLSKAPMPRWSEGPYSFASNSPPRQVDPLGLAPTAAQGDPIMNADLGPNEIHVLLDLSLEQVIQIAICTAFARWHGNSEGGGADPRGNAVKHCHWSCCMTRAAGRDAAERMGDAHEQDHPGAPGDSESDQQNNATGRRFGHYICTSGADTECFDLCQNALDHGRLDMTGGGVPGKAQ